jgi:hypothetical protein
MLRVQVTEVQGDVRTLLHIYAPLEPGRFKDAALDMVTRSENRCRRLGTSHLACQIWSRKIVGPASHAGHWGGG